MILSVSRQLIRAYIPLASILPYIHGVQTRLGVLLVDILSISGLRLGVTQALYKSTSRERLMTTDGS